MSLRVDLSALGELMNWRIEDGGPRVEDGRCADTAKIKFCCIRVGASPTQQNLIFAMSVHPGLDFDRKLLVLIENGGFW